MRVFLTGASGFVGSSVVRQLLERDYQVRVLIRSTSPRTNLEGLDVERVEGDLLDSGSLIRACQGCRVFFHVAADYRLWARDPGMLHRTNVEGTRNALNAATENQVDRFVYTSSVATLGLNPDGRPADENTPSRLESMIGPYKRSKFEAEALVTDWVRARRLDAVIVNPSTPVGPRDVRPTPTGRLVRDAATGRMPAYVDTGLNIVHVDDVARGHLQALDRGRTGERYILGGENLALRDILEQVSRCAGRPGPRVRLPLRPLWPIALAAECWGRVSGQEPRLTRDALAMARKKMYFSSAKAESELGYGHRPAEAAIRDAVQWFLRQPVPQTENRVE
jgi:dihydroflavonol-4-reductase